MLQLPGAPALSDFRIAKLLAGLEAREPGVTGLDARFMHFVDIERDARTSQQRQSSQRLLTYGPRSARAVHDEPGEFLLVVPRAGTISPWSSKATDIAHVCGLDAVRRIERGIAYRLQRDRGRSGTERLACAGARACSIA